MAVEKDARRGTLDPLCSGSRLLLPILGVGLYVRKLSRRRRDGQLVVDQGCESWPFAAFAFMSASSASRSARRRSLPF